MIYGGVFYQNDCFGNEVLCMWLDIEEFICWCF